MDHGDYPARNLGHMMKSLSAAFCNQGHVFRKTVTIPSLLRRGRCEAPGSVQSRSYLVDAREVLLINWY
jgi:hypothetical protein